MLEKQALDAEQVEILGVVESDLRSYLARDKAAWELNWVQDERMTSFMECGTLQIARGYEEFRRNVFQAMDADPAPTSPEVMRDNISIQIVDDLAWVVFDQTLSETDDPVAPPILSHNFRLLERKNGQWRIVIHGVWAHPFRNSLEPTIEVEDNARVQWMNNAAKESLKTFEGLTISAGILRASRPAWDKKLRAAIERVAKLRNYAEYNKAAAGPNRLTSYPVLLGEDDSGVVLLCFVHIAKGRIYVSFGQNTALDSQIKMAGMLFGLSDSQMDIAARIANGSDLADAAKQMGISINTARTHLRRMFDKTDARSQIDLLRLFLSLG